MKPLVLDSGALIALERRDRRALALGRLRFVAVVFDPVEVRRLLAHLHCFSDPLPVHPARAPPEHEESFDFP